MKYELHIEMNNKAKAFKETYSVESGNLRQMVYKVTFTLVNTTDETDIVTRDLSFEYAI